MPTTVPAWSNLEALEPRVLMHGATDLPGDHGDGGVIVDTHEDRDVHIDDTDKQSEHLAMLDLVPFSAVTHTVVRDGLWSDPNTWLDGLTPGDDAHVLVAEGVTVVYDVQNETEPYHTVRVDGVLKFDITQDTLMRVDTLVITPEGTLVIGTEANPVEAGVSAKISITDGGDIDTVWDPLLLSRGVLSHGDVEIHGAHVTPFLALTQAPRAGDTQLVLSGVPENWQVGDRLVLTGTSPFENQDEELSLLSISGNTVTVRPLAFDHLTPTEDLSVYLTNVTRNVSVTSENAELISRRGHVMFMHSNKVHVENAGFYGLGRTDKAQPLTDPLLDDQGQLIPGTGANPRGRYAVHFHKHGVDFNANPAVVRGSVVVGSPGLGFVNHGSYVIMEDNVAFDVFGSAFFTEDGSEIGSFRRNLAIRSTGSGESAESREDIVDFGHGGHGFWFQGVGGLDIEDNIAVGQATNAFFIFPCRCRTEGTPIEAVFPTENLVDPSIANGADSIAITNAPGRTNRGNLAFASGVGFGAAFYQRFANHDGEVVIEDLTVWGVRSSAVAIPYVNNFVFRNARLLGFGGGADSTAITRNTPTRNITFENLHVEGWKIGINVPIFGENKVLGGYYDNKTNFLVSGQVNGTFDLVGAQAGPATQKNLVVGGQPRLRRQDIAGYLSTRSVRGMVFVDGQRVFFANQAADFVPFIEGQAPGFIPQELIGKTNQQLWDEYGLAVGGEIAPEGSGADGRQRARITVDGRPNLRLASDEFPAQVEGYVLKYTNEAGGVFTDSEPVNLHVGWNLITRKIQGHTHSFFVFGTVNPPRFEFAGTLAINPLAFSIGHEIRGKVFDDFTGVKSLTRRFSALDLQELPVITKDDGSNFVVITFQISDRAGNITGVELELKIDSSAPLTVELRDTKVIDDPEILTRIIRLSDTLRALLGFNLELLSP